VLATLSAAALICAASLAVGEAIAAALGRERGRGWSPAVGLGVLLAVAAIAIKLPGHGVTAAVVCALLVAAAAIFVWRGGGVRRPDGDAIAATLAVLGLTLLPFLASGRFGVIGVGFLNDMTAHLAWAETLKDPAADGPVMTRGYPPGPHALAATISSGTGMGVDWSFNGLLIAIQILIAWTVLPLLDGLSRWRRALGATLVATCFLLSAFYVQASFKETALALFLIASVALLRDARRDWAAAGVGTGVQLGALIAGTVFAYSYGGLAWLVLAVAIWGALELVAALLDTPPRSVATRLRSALSPRSGPLAVLLGAALGTALLTLPDLGRFFDALNLFGSSPSGTGVIADNSLAHLAGPLSPYEIFGLFPIDDFRFAIEQRYRNGALVGLGVAATAFGALWWLLKRDLIVPAAAAAAGIIAVYLRIAESPYLTSKGYAIAAPFAMLLAVRALLDPWPATARMPAIRIARAAVAAIFCGAALMSSYKVLHGGEIGPRAHTDELREVAKELRGEPTLFLGFDDFSLWELHGVPVTLPADGFHLPVPDAFFDRRPQKRWTYGDPFDFDSARWRDLDKVRYAITTGSRNQSLAPPNFHAVARTPSYVAWERRGPTQQRLTLDEGRYPGAVLDCRSRAGRELSRRDGWAVVRRPPVIVLVPEEQRHANPGGEVRVRVPLPAGRWELSQQYMAEQDVEVEGPGVAATLPANLDRPGPWYAFGELRRRRPGAVELTLRVGDAPLETNTHVSDLLGIAAVDLDDRPRAVPLRQACGRYVDWYTLARQRPATPSAG